jgi:hypothetical protein
VEVTVIKVRAVGLILIFTLLARGLFLKSSPKFSWDYVDTQVSECLDNPTQECIAHSKFLLRNVDREQVKDSIPYSYLVYLVEEKYGRI